MELLMAGRFGDAAAAYGYVATVFEQVASGERGPTFTITPSARHVGVTRRDTRRPGFDGAVRAAEEEGYPVLVRGSGGGATAAHYGTFGFSIMRPSKADEVRRGVRERYDEVGEMVLGALRRLGVRGAEVGEVRDEFCPGDHSIRVGGFEEGMKLAGIAQRVTRKAASVGGILLVRGEEELARALERVYGALDLPMRPGSVGSLRKAGSGADVDEAMEALAEEARLRYGATPVKVDEKTLEQARARRDEFPARSSTA